MSSRSLDDRLGVPAAEGAFAEHEIAGLPGPVQRFLRAALVPGVPLARAGRLRMRGSIKVGRWLRFRASELLAPQRGFVWSARVAGILTGSDHYADGDSGMRWKLAGFVPFLRSSGPDAARSAAGRCAAEAVWVPSVLLPRFGVDWTATDDRLVTAQFGVHDLDARLEIAVDGDGHVRWARLDRWGDPDATGAWGWHRFGIEVTESRTFAGLTIPAVGSGGWWPGTDRWREGEFFRFEISDLQPIEAPAARVC